MSPVLSEAELESMRETVAETFTMTCTVLRDEATTSDGYGNPVAADFQPLTTTQECYLWAPVQRQASEELGPVKTAQYQELRMKLPVDADVTERDLIYTVTNELGEVINASQLQVRAVQMRPTHKLLILQRQAVP